MEPDKTIVRVALTVPLGNAGAQMSFETSFFRDAPAEQLNAVLDKLESVAGRQVAKGQISAIEDSLARNAARMEAEEASHGRLLVAQGNTRTNAEVKKLEADIGATSSNLEHLARERALLGEQLKALKQLVGLTDA